MNAPVLRYLPLFLSLIAVSCASGPVARVYQVRGAQEMQAIGETVSDIVQAGDSFGSFAAAIDGDEVRLSIRGWSRERMNDRCLVASPEQHRTLERLLAVGVVRGGLFSSDAGKTAYLYAVYPPEDKPASARPTMQPVAAGLILTDEPQYTGKTLIHEPDIESAALENVRTIRRINEFRILHDEP